MDTAEGRETGAIAIDRRRSTIWAKLRCCRQFLQPICRRPTFRHAIVYLERSTQILPRFCQISAGWVGRRCSVWRHVERPLWHSGFTYCRYDEPRLGVFTYILEPTANGANCRRPSFHCWFHTWIGIVHVQQGRAQVYSRTQCEREHDAEYREKAEGQRDCLWFSSDDGQ